MSIAHRQLARHFFRPALAALSVVGVLIGLSLVRISFDWALLWTQLRQLSVWKLGIAVAFIYLSVTLRAVRWAVLLKPICRVSFRELTGPQFMGFACVALFGSVGDLTRPYLLARRVRAPVSSLIATYTIERAADLGAAALIFLVSEALAGEHRLANNNHSLLLTSAFSAVAMSAILAGALVFSKTGEVIADIAERVLARLSPGFAGWVAARIRLFANGMRAVSGIGDLAKVAGLSLAIWGLIAGAFVHVVQAFGSTPALAALTFPQTMLLVAASIGGSLVQLPVIGWFTQIAAMALTMHVVLNVPIEPATACGAALLSATFLFLIPAGLLCAYLNGVTLISTLRLSGRGRR